MGIRRSLFLLVFHIHHILFSELAENSDHEDSFSPFIFLFSFFHPVLGLVVFFIHHESTFAVLTDLYEINWFCAD